MRLKLRKTAISSAVVLCLSFAVAPLALAQSNNAGAITGHTAAGAIVTVVNPRTGFTRSVKARANGSYRFSYIPVGTYTLSAKRSGKTVGATKSAQVNIGQTTTVNFGSANTVNLAAVQVTSSAVTPTVDVHSTVTAMNITRQQLDRIPVERNVTAVALLAPGVVKGNGGIGGISFDGASGSENAYYINGLNVTGFYSRMGFTEAPYAFYKQFQVLTGGYSVKYGRTTGGVVNAVVRTGTNKFHAGADLYVEPGSLQSTTHDRYDKTGRRYITSSRDGHSLLRGDVWASGPIIKNKLFFFVLFQPRRDSPHNTNDAGTVMTRNKSNTSFYGGTLNWNINENNTLELMYFSNTNQNAGKVYPYDFNTGTDGKLSNTVYSNTGGRNYTLSWTSYFTDNLSMKLEYGQLNRETYNHSALDAECDPVNATNAALAINDPGVPIGCTTNGILLKRNAKRKEYRADFLWTLGNHLLSFGAEYENDSIIYARHYSGPDQLQYNVRQAAPGAILFNGARLPAGFNMYVNTRDYRVEGTFPTIRKAAYVSDAWSVTPNLLIKIGLRDDDSVNESESGSPFIKLKNQIAPRLGASWNVFGDGTTKLFANAGRYFLPVTGAVNVNEAGGLLDARRYYPFEGWQIETLKGGNKYAVPKLGPQLGPMNDSQGDGKVGDLRSSVDHNMQPVYQDQFELGFQHMLNAKWSWGVTATYRTIHNAIDDMHITATPECGGQNGGVGWVMANPAKELTVWGDTNCDGVPDGWININLAKQGWALFDAQGKYLGQRGWKKPKRRYYGLQFKLHRAWDGKWMFNATYVLSWNRGNYEGPVNTDTDYDAAGRTENFDTPFFNDVYGNLPNDRRNVLKLRGAYAFNHHWRIGGTLLARSGNPVSAIGEGNPFDATNYTSYWICVKDCSDPHSENRVYEPTPGGRGGYERTPFIFNLNFSLSYALNVGEYGHLLAKFSVFNALNRQATTFVDQTAQGTISDQISPTFLQPIGFQAARYAAFTVSYRY